MTSLLYRLKILEFPLVVAVITLVFLVVVNTSGIYAPFALLSISFATFLFYLGSKTKGAFFFFYLLLCISFLENNEGIEAIELPFYFASVLLFGYLIFELLRGALIIETFLDKLFILFLFLLGFATIVGMLNGANPYRAFGEVTRFFGLFLYFPLRKYLPEKKFRALFFGAILVIIAFVVLRNLINYRQLLTQAVVSWQAENTRVAANEFIILMGGCLFMSYAAITSSLIRQLLSTLIFLALIGALILTQSRGYWLAFAFAALIIFLVINNRGKIRILITFLVISATSFIIATLFFGNLLDLAIAGLSARFETLGSGKLDVSLLERLLESKTVFSLSLQNPITGYGLGVEFTKKILFYNHFVSTSYVHNGYLAASYKFGLVGLSTILIIWGILIRKSYLAYKGSSCELRKILMLSICGTMAGVLLVNNTSPQTLTFESTLFITIFSAYVSTESIPKNERPD